MLVRAITSEELHAVLARYAIGALIAPPAPAGGTANANLKLSAASGEYFLRRRNPRYSAEDFVAFDHALMTHMARYNVRTPRAVASRSGKTWVRIGEAVYELFHCQPGGPHDRHSMAQLASAGRALAGYHRAARDFSPPPGGAPPAGKDWPRYDDPRLIHAGIRDIEAELRQRLTADDLDYLMSQVALLERELPDERYHVLPKLVVHGDYHPGNLKFLADEVAGIFDLDWATVQPRARDLADGIFLFAGERDGDIDASNISSLTQTWRPSVERGGVFMGAYLASETVTEEEVAALPVLIRARWLYCRVAGMAKVDPAQRVEYFAAGLLEPLRMLDRMERLF